MVTTNETVHMVEVKLRKDSTAVSAHDLKTYASFIDVSSGKSIATAMKVFCMRRFGAKPKPAVWCQRMFGKLSSVEYLM